MPRSSSSSRPPAHVRHYLLLASVPYTTGKGIRDYHLQTAKEDAGVTHLDRGFMNRSISWELKHIPRGDKGSLQNSLRFSYNILRRKNMVLGKSRHETMKELVEKMQRLHPDFTPVYDKEVFKL